MRNAVFVGMLMLYMVSLGGMTKAQGRQTAQARFIYVAGGPGCSRVFQFRVDREGRRQPLSPPWVSVLGSASSAVVAPGSRAVYVPEGDFFDVAQFHARRNGVLSPMRPPSVAADAHPTALVFDPSGRYAYVSCSHGDICQYRVQRDGALVPLSPPAVYISAGGVRNPSPVAFSQGGRWASVWADLAEGEPSTKVRFRFRVKRDGCLVLLDRRLVSRVGAK